MNWRLFVRALYPDRERASIVVYRLHIEPLIKAGYVEEQDTFPWTQLRLASGTSPGDARVLAALLVLE